MSELWDTLGVLGRLLWGILRGIFGLMTLVQNIGYIRDIYRALAGRSKRRASHLGTDLESPHISHMTPPPDRPLEDKTNDRT